MQKRLFSLIITIALCSMLFGCSVPASISQEVTHDAYLEGQYQGVTFASKFVEDIPVFEVYVDDNKQKPVMFIMHGYMGNRYYSTELAAHYARNGYYAVIFDAYGHGARTGGALKSFPEVMAMYPYDAEKIVNSLKNNPQADLSNMGMMGISMGACAIYKYCTIAEIKPKAIAPLVGTPYYEQFMSTDLSREIYDEKSGTHDPILSQSEYNRILAEASPYKNYLALEDVSILMQQGALDTMVVGTGADMLYHDLKGIGKEDIELIIYPDMAHHDLKDECFDKAFEFFEGKLK